jgi:hypothetical protein
MIERNGKSFCLYAGLLDEAHRQGLSEIRTTLIQIPSDDNGNVAICQSEVKTEKGVFTGLGDASPQNVSRAMANCLIRLAETRSKARALRDAVNVGVVAFEELDSEGSSDASEPGARPATPSRPNRGADLQAGAHGPGPDERSLPADSLRPPARSPEEQPHPASSLTSDGEGITEAQRRMLASLARQAGEAVKIDNLSRRKASQLITELKARLGSRIP